MISSHKNNLSLEKQPLELYKCGSEDIEECSTQDGKRLKHDQSLLSCLWKQNVIYTHIC